MKTKRKRNYSLRHRKVDVGIYDDFDNGFWAGRGGAPVGVCPYAVGTGSRDRWVDGWWAGVIDSGIIAHHVREGTK